MWTKLAAANAQHYIDHPYRHFGIAAVVGVIGLIVFAFTQRKLVNPKNDLD